MTERLSIIHAIQEISKGMILKQQRNCPPPLQKKWILILKIITFIHKCLGIILLRVTFH